MPTIADITNAASYKGSMELGGGGGLVLDIDTKPFQQLAQYTYLYNRDQYIQRQKNADEKIKELAGLTAYNLVDGLPKDKEELVNAQAKLTDYMAKEASLGPANSPKEKMLREVDFQSKIKDQVKLINAANARKIKLDTYVNTVQKLDGLSAQEKELRINQAKKLFEDTDIYTLPEIPNHDLTMPKGGDPIYEDVTYLRETPNGMIKETKKQFSITANNKMSFLEGNNLLPPMLPPNATQQQKDEYEQRRLAFNKTPNGGWQNAAQFFNAAVNDPNYKVTETTTGINVTGEPANTSLTETIDIEKIKSQNPIVGGIINVAERYNKYAQDRIAEIKQGYYIDTVTGEKMLLTAADRAEDIPIIDVTKPISAANLDLLQRFEKAAPDKVDKTFTQTDNDIQQKQMENQIKLKKLDEAGANYRARLAAATKGSGKDKPEEVIDKPAILFGQHIDRLKNKFKENGGKPIEIGFPGIDANTRIATGIQEDQSIIYKPDGSFEIQDKDNKVLRVGLIENLAQGFINAVKTVDLAGKDKDGTMAEGFQLKSEAKFNELFGTTSGKVIWEGWDSKEPVTVTQTVVAEAELSSDPKDWKKEGKNYRYKDGTLYDSKGNIIK